MISCSDFRDGFRPETSDSALLEHLRGCDVCLDFAVAIDPDAMFRAIGTDEMIPPGGVDAFVDEVMRAVDLRSKESAMQPAERPHWGRRLAAAAALALGVTAATLSYEWNRAVPVGTAAPVAVMAHRAPATTTKPAVDTYSSSNATIVEVPAENATDARVVMVIDDTLPADL